MQNAFYLLAFILFLISCTSSPQANQGNDFSAQINYDSLRTVLEKIYDTDQGLREKVSNMNPYDPALVAELNRADSVNQIEVKNIVDTYGWLGSSQIGQKAADALYYVIQHADLESIEYFFPMMKKAAETGEANRLYAATMEDRMLKYQGKKQIYGTQGHGQMKDDGTFDSFIWPIEDPEHVNERRKQAGFETTVEENAKRLNSRYDPNEPLPQKN